MPKRKPSPAQIAHQVTWRLEGDIKRNRLSSLSISVQLARVRDEKLWSLLDFDSIEKWAFERLGMSRSTLYRYLQMHDWVKQRHPKWLAPKVRGFIPDLSDVAILRAIETQLDRALTPERRKVFQALYAKALEGKLTPEEYKHALGGRPPNPPIRAFFTSLRAMHARAKRIAGLPSDIERDLAAIVTRLDEFLRSGRAVAKLAPRVRTELVALGLKDFTSLRA